MSTIQIIGLGAGSEDDLTIRAQEALSERIPAFARTDRHPIVNELRKNIDIDRFDDYFEKYETFDEVFDEVCTGTTSTEGATNYQLGDESEKPAARNPGLPFGSLAYGMLMVMGGTVACRKHQ